MPSILDKIVAAKRVERQAAEQPRPLCSLNGGGIRLIAEVKKTSPSTDVVEEDLDLKAVMVDSDICQGPPARRWRKKAAARLTSRLIDKLSAVVEAGLPPSSWPWLTRPDALSGLR